MTILTRRASWRVLVGSAVFLVGAVSLLVGGWVINWPELLAWMQEGRQSWQNYVAMQPVLSSTVFLVVYVVFAGLALPGAMVLTLAGGAVFGWWGVLLVSFASTTGATLAMLLSRFLLRDWVRAHYGERLRALQSELDRAGAWYLLSLRLNPAVPFFLVNVAFGLTQLSVWRFWWISQIGMLPATVIYVWAGTELDRAVASGQIVQPRLIASLVAVSFLPLFVRWCLRYKNSRQSSSA